MAETTVCVDCGHRVAGWYAAKGGDVCSPCAEHRNLHLAEKRHAELHQRGPAISDWCSHEAKKEGP